MSGSESEHYEYNGEVWPDNNMKLDDWVSKWDVNQIGFHKDTVFP